MVFCSSLMAGQNKEFELESTDQKQLSGQQQNLPISERFVTGDYDTKQEPIHVSSSHIRMYPFTKDDCEILSTILESQFDQFSINLFLRNIFESTGILETLEAQVFKNYNTMLSSGIDSWFQYTHQNEKTWNIIIKVLKGMVREDIIDIINKLLRDRLCADSDAQQTPSFTLLSYQPEETVNHHDCKVLNMVFKSQFNPFEMEIFLRVLLEETTISENIICPMLKNSEDLLSGLHYWLKYRLVWCIKKPLNGIIKALKIIDREDIINFTDGTPRKNVIFSNNTQQVFAMYTNKVNSALSSYQFNKDFTKKTLNSADIYALYNVLRGKLDLTETHCLLQNIPIQGRLMRELFSNEGEYSLDDKLRFSLIWWFTNTPEHSRKWSVIATALKKFGRVNIIDDIEKGLL